MKIIGKSEVTIKPDDLTKQINKEPINKRLLFISALLGGITPEDIKRLDASDKCTFRNFLKTIAKKFEK